MVISSKYFYEHINEADELPILLMHNYVPMCQKAKLTDPIYFSIGEALEDGVSVSLSVDEAETLSSELMKFVEYYRKLDNE